MGSFLTMKSARSVRLHCRGGRQHPHEIAQRGLQSRGLRVSAQGVAVHPASVAKSWYCRPNASATPVAEMWDVPASRTDSSIVRESDRGHGAAPKGKESCAYYTHSLTHSAKRFRSLPEDSLSQLSRGDSSGVAKAETQPCEVGARHLGVGRTEAEGDDDGWPRSSRRGRRCCVGPRHALNSPRIAFWMMPNGVAGGIAHRAAATARRHSSSTAWRWVSSTCCRATSAPACCSSFRRRKRSGQPQVLQGPSRAVRYVLHSYDHYVLYGPPSESKSRPMRGFRPCFGFRRRARAIRSRASWPSSDSWSHPPVDNLGSSSHAAPCAVPAPAGGSAACAAEQRVFGDLRSVFMPTTCTAFAAAWVSAWLTRPR